MGRDGPQRSISRTPTDVFGSIERANARLVVKEDLPTPPFPDKMRILFLTDASLEAIMGISGCLIPLG